MRHGPKYISFLKDEIYTLKNFFFYFIVPYPQSPGKYKVKLLWNFYFTTGRGAKIKQKRNKTKYHTMTINADTYMGKEHYSLQVKVQPGIATMEITVEFPQNAEN